MPHTIQLMTCELKKIAWNQELVDRREAEATRERYRRGKRAEEDDAPIVFDETQEEALHSLAIDILAAYKDCDTGINKSVAYVRKVIPVWMTWPMLNEWAQRYNFQLKLTEIQKRIVELEKKEAELLAQSGGWREN